jgi:hypothetical protein
LMFGNTKAGRLYLFLFFIFIHFFGIAHAGATAQWRTFVVTQQ